MTGTYVPKPEWLVLDWHRVCLEAEALTVQRCDECGTWRHPPRRFCAECASPASSFEPVAGTGTIVSLAVSHRSLDPGWQAEVPFATLVVELDEGPRVLAATTTAPARIRIGSAVRCTVERRSEDFVLVWAEPIDTETTEG
ncbi:MAG TPA: hypothetical protein DCS55_24175 [Acidimicrobiaceae bacterium]|nr:hypothetical protein [Acidimicrobiaceae bacterium]